jgi:hypothetical protein
MHALVPRPSDTTPSVMAAVATVTGPARIVALDFTKGTLVLIMVLYHWLNYFMGPVGFIYRYLRFLPPSFIFITGFLISHVYLSRSHLTAGQLARRLAARGFKILVVFAFLNLIKLAVIPDSRNAFVQYLSSRTLTAVYITGSFGTNKAAAFSVLVPIGYLLVLSAGLILAREVYRHIFHLICAMALFCTFLLDSHGFNSANLQLITIGLLGVSSGYIAIGEINRFAIFPYILIGAYGCYLSIITLWEVNYPVQILGVSLTLMLIYSLGLRYDLGRLGQLTVLMGHYSLFAYIAQIAVVQLLYNGLRRFAFTPGVLALSFLLACVLTMLSVTIMDGARRRARPVDVLYKTIFA